ncbi:hypothetical protein O9992_27215 [Vibrio lentus]|nr:hypothetical protein [Vibrio lentus]
MMVQRCMAAKSMGDAKKAMLMMGLCCFLHLLRIHSIRRVIQRLLRW